MSNQIFTSVNPATGETFAEHPILSDQQVDEAVQKSGAAFQTWRALSIEARAQYVDKLAQLFIDKADELAEIMTKDMGKPVTEARDEAEFCGSILRYYAHNGPRLAQSEVITEDEDTISELHRLPVGPLLGIMPWNFPYYQIARFIAPNLVLGNTILLKHAESCGESALAVQRLVDEAGFPEGVYQNIFVSHEQVSGIIESPVIQGVSLTGSERAGAIIAEQAGRNLKKAVLELGGSDPYVILDTDDLDAAVEHVIALRMENTGQACNSNKRLIVMDDIYQDFVDKIVAKISALTPGDPMEAESGTFCPMSSEGAADLIVDQIERAKAAGATVHTGGQRLDRAGFYVQPAVITDIPVGSDIYYEELFGPAFAIFKVSSDEEALALANNTQYGLGSQVYSTDQARAEKFARGIHAGMVGANTAPEETEAVPFGGVKNSGYGRELGPVGMEEFVNKQLYTRKK